MTEKYGDIDWLNLRGDDGIQKTKALYRAFIDVDKRSGVTGDALLFQILGDAGTGGLDYMRNFRAGKIAKFKAEMIHHWLTKNHFEMARTAAPDLFPHPAKDAFQEFIDTHAVTGKLRVIRFRNEMGIVQRSNDKREYVETLRLSEKFCFELNTEINGVALAFQRYQGKWYPLPLGSDQRRFHASVEQGTNQLPRADDGSPISLEENDDAGSHQFAVVVSTDRRLTEDIMVPSLTLDGDEFEVHLISVRFVT